MAYLGRGIENLSDRVVLDALTASATASYTLQLNSVNFVPSSASSLTVSLNGVIQKPDSSYTVSGSTLTFSSALTSSDSIDFIIAERGITLQTPSAGSVNTDQLAASAVTNAKIASDAAIATTKLGTGAIVQVQTLNVSASSGDTTSTTYSDVSGYSLDITPNSTSNKIFVSMSFSPENRGSGTDRGIKYRFTRNGTVIFTQSYDCYISGDSGQKILYSTPTHVDSPSSTSTLTYKLQYGVVGANSTARINNYGEGSIVLMEIAG